MEDICVNFLNPVQYFRFLKGHCYGNQFCGKTVAKLTTPPALIALSFRNRMAYRYFNERINSANVASILCENFVCMGEAMTISRMGDLNARL